MPCTPYSPMMPSPVSATMTSTFSAASSEKSTLATRAPVRGPVQTMPASVKSITTSAPESCMLSVSRISDTPVSLAPPTRKPACASLRTMAAAANVLPAFMQVPTTKTTGHFTGADVPFSAPEDTCAGCPVRDISSGNSSTWPSTSASKGRPTPWLCDVHLPMTPPMLSTCSRSPTVTDAGTTPS
ncbi:hypothetical protein [Myxococcus sp. NMCA1]|uniref:hypothetical protein n=1 Tax=Myxococcus sp. NMCA1 TaxID=2996785 RepID=UPI002E2467EA